MSPDRGHSGTPDEWGIVAVDVDACLRRLGITDPADKMAAPSAELLKLLHRAHVTTYCHENVEVVLGRAVTVDLADIRRRLVDHRRGGNCLELNLLFAALLERLGFTVTRLAGRVRMGSTVPRPLTHVALRVDVDGRPWLADVGFSGPGLLDPLPLEDGATAVQDSWGYGLRREGDGYWCLFSDRGGVPFDLYAFSLAPQHAVDYVVANHYITTHPRSPFTGQLIVQRSLPEERLLLRDTTWTRTFPDSSERVEQIPAHQAPELLREQFDLHLTNSDAQALSARLGSRV
ncbi:arylamine N-acetyltransferase [Streptomyces sp. NPDC000877]|uniref:arylamine N-acetyltransferase family protein n=1 Tax=unclassified Streptomyces TaxID=2593676 RepID=UPI00331FCCD2